MRDAMASTVMEDGFGLSLAEWGWSSHDFHSVRHRLGSALSHPDDVRAMHMSSVNRKHRYVEHYRKSIGNDQKNMIVRWSDKQNKQNWPIIWIIGN
jgi:hypothetical protein